MTTKFFKKILFAMILAAFVAMLTLTINTLAKSAKAQSEKIDSSGRFEIHGIIETKLIGQKKNLFRSILAICDTGNGTMIYEMADGDGSLAVVPNGCNKK